MVVLAVSRYVCEGQTRQRLFGLVFFVIGSRLLIQSVYPEGQIALLVGIVEVERESSVHVGAGRCREAEVLCFDGREARDNRCSGLLGGRPVGEISFPLMGRFFGRNDDVLIQGRLCIEGYRRQVVRVLRSGRDIFDDQLSLRVLVNDMHGDRVVAAVAGYRLNRGREDIYFRFMRRHYELLLRLHHLRDTADGVELDIIQCEVITDDEFVGVFVHHRNGHIIAVLFCIEGLGVLMPDIIPELRLAQIQFTGFPGMAVILDAEHEARGIVHLTVVVDVRRPEREHIGRTFLQFQFCVIGRCRIPCFLVTSGCAGHGVEEREVRTLTRLYRGIRRSKIMRIADDGKTVTAQVARVDACRLVLIEIKRDSTCLVKIAPVVILAYLTYLSVFAVFPVAVILFVASILHHILHRTGCGIVLFVGVGERGVRTERTDGQRLRSALDGVGHTRLLVLNQPYIGVSRIHIFRREHEVQTR